MTKRETIISNVRRYGIVQLVNRSKDVTVTFRMKNGLCFVTNYFEHELPISTYLNFDDIQSKLTTDEIVNCCNKAMDEGGWKFYFWSRT